MSMEPETLGEALAREDTCPRCLGELDTGWECNDCGYDAAAEAGCPGLSEE
jgi:tRNA(Ile2) C34 agmatinyltransferase TiaS